MGFQDRKRMFFEVGKAIIERDRNGSCRESGFASMPGSESGQANCPKPALGEDLHLTPECVRRHAGWSW
jgi:hypothetical protein